MCIFRSDVFVIYSAQSHLSLLHIFQMPSAALINRRYLPTR